ncbi:hypothetical protein L6452_26320 [Arctium lappa]|uniref:Uncharacterized protein n=1 Tax=Arctium lappa TaxID=4217 RepID=A0ACB9ACG6_ARCLA|nr:hypothetical protein L6452_26320 [Arctium lappa]
MQYFISSSIRIQLCIAVSVKMLQEWDLYFFTRRWDAAALGWSLPGEIENDQLAGDIEYGFIMSLQQQPLYPTLEMYILESFGYTCMCLVLHLIIEDPSMVVLL